MYELMYTMRVMEATSEAEYAARNIRGFCHLYQGQEAVATGIQYALDPAVDSWITSYRCHCVALARGASVSQVMGELFGNAIGTSRGKGGSMHFYNKAANFFGGQGIVGAQVPLGAGLAFAAKYRHEVLSKNLDTPTPVAIGCYGDGAANQGQIWETANMCALWKLPFMFCIENNQYGMGTSTDRHSSVQEYYKMGNVAIPWLRIDGMNVLAVREGIRFAKEYCGSGLGPLFIELMTYRFRGHSVSDNTKLYRDQEEVALVRADRDPVKHAEQYFVDAGFAADDQVIKNISKRIREHVKAEVLKAKESPKPNPEILIQDIFATSLEPHAPSELPPHVRMPDYANSFWIDGKKE
jgi:pyruvate dehydrogenase E1 component alpha subunit